MAFLYSTGCGVWLANAWPNQPVSRKSTRRQTLVKTWRNSTVGWLNWRLTRIKALDMWTKAKGILDNKWSSCRQRWRQSKWRWKKAKAIARSCLKSWPIARRWSNCLLRAKPPSSCGRIWGSHSPTWSSKWRRPRDLSMTSSLLLKETDNKLQ